MTDGPFAETKEALGGYYLIEANDLDHALAVAKLCPAPNGGVEVRPVLDTSGGRPGSGAEGDGHWLAQRMVAYRSPCASEATG